MQKNLTAVVTVRKNSVRVPNKNPKTFCGKNILVHKIEVLKKIKGLDGIIINTDSDEAIAIAQKYDVSHFRREDYFASSECTNSEFWANIAQNTKSKYIMFTHCTNPLLKVETYIKFIETSALGIPCICQDLEPYSKYTDTVFKDSNDLQNQIDAILKDKKILIPNNLLTGTFLHYPKTLQEFLV